MDLRSGGGGVVVGYLTGCPNSHRFAKAKLGRFSLPLLVDICRGRYPGTGTPAGS